MNNYISTSPDKIPHVLIDIVDFRNEDHPPENIAIVGPGMLNDKEMGELHPRFPQVAEILASLHLSYPEKKMQVEILDKSDFVVRSIAETTRERLFTPTKNAPEHDIDFFELNHTELTEDEANTIFKIKQIVRENKGVTFEQFTISSHVVDIRYDKLAERFDLIFATFVLNNIPEAWTQSLENLLSGLKTGGELYMEECPSYENKYLEMGLFERYQIEPIPIFFQGKMDEQTIEALKRKKPNFFNNPFVTTLTTAGDRNHLRFSLTRGISVLTKY